MRSIKIRIYNLKIFEKCYSPSGQSIVNEVNRNIHSRKGLTFQRRVILRINASNIKIIDSYSENVKKSYLIDFVSFAAQDSNQGCIFRNNFQKKNRRPGYPASGPRLGHLKGSGTFLRSLKP